MYDRGLNCDHERTNVLLLPGATGGLIAAVKSKISRANANGETLSGDDTCSFYHKLRIKKYRYIEVLTGVFILHFTFANSEGNIVAYFF